MRVAVDEDVCPVFTCSLHGILIAVTDAVAVPVREKKGMAAKGENKFFRERPGEVIVACDHECRAANVVFVILFCSVKIPGVYKRVGGSV